MFQMIPGDRGGAAVTRLDPPLKGTMGLVTLGPSLNLSGLRWIIYKTRVIILLHQKLPRWAD